MVYITGGRLSHEQTAKLFPNGRSQAVRLPAPFRFEGNEVYIRRDPETGEVVLSSAPSSWDSFFALRESLAQERTVFKLRRPR